jgi:hypothetical protein
MNDEADIKVEIPIMYLQRDEVCHFEQKYIHYEDKLRTLVKRFMRRCCKSGTQNH